MKIIKAGTFGYYDVFLGLGWEKHTRVQVLRQTGGLRIINGLHLNVKQLAQVQEGIAK